MERRALGIDLGSSSVRAVVFETAGPGRLVAVDGAIARRPRHVSSSQPGQATFGADSYLADLVACIDELGAKGHLEGVTEVGMDCQMHSVLPVDAAGRALADVVSWADTRACPPAGAAAVGPDRRETLRQRTGCAFAPMYWTWRVPWLAAEAGAGTLTGGDRPPARFLGLSEYVGLELLGDPSMSVSMASATGLLATAEHAWDEETLELAGIPGAALPPLGPPGWEGRLAGNWQRRWPALARARWHPALIDGAAANLGTGCDTPFRAALTVGTSAAVRSVRPAPDQSVLPAGLWRYCVDYDRVLLGAAFSTGGQLYSWALALWEGSLTAGPAGGAASVPSKRTTTSAMASRCRSARAAKECSCCRGTRARARPLARSPPAKELSSGYGSAITVPTLSPQPRKRCASNSPAVWLTSRPTVANGSK